MFGWDQHWRRCKGRTEQRVGGTALGGLAVERSSLIRIKPNSLKLWKPTNERVSVKRHIEPDVVKRLGLS